MSKVNWINIFKLYEINKYCELGDFIQLSMVCKVVRASFSDTILNNFDFASFIDCKEYKSCIIENYRYDMENEVFRIVNPYIPMIDDLLESKKRFISDLNQYRYNVVKLNLIGISDHFYLVYEVPNVFQNLRNLVIEGAFIMLDTIQHLMDNLACLEDLDFCNSILYKRLNGLNSIILPITLKRLNIDYVAIGYIEEREEDAIFRYSIDPDEEYAELDLSPKKLPNLLYLNYQPYYENNGYGLLQFLKLNQNLKHLCLNRLNFNPELFNLVKTFNNLIKFECDLSNRDDIDISLVSAPVDSYIRNLCILLPKRSDFLNMLTEQLPNLTDLSITNTPLRFNQLWPILSKFKKLKNLKLENYISRNFSKELNSQKFFNLESIEFLTGENVGFQGLDIDINSFPKLKLIKFTMLRYYRTEYDISKVPVEIKSNWELVYFPRKLSFYRKMEQNSNNNALNFAQRIIYKNERISKKDSEYKEIEKLFSQLRGTKDSFYNKKENLDEYSVGIKDEEVDGKTKEVNSSIRDNFVCEGFSNG